MKRYVNIKFIERRFTLCIFVLLLVGTSKAYSQDFATCSEIGFYGGGSYYIGDLNPNRHFVNSKPAFGLIYRYNASKRHSIRATAFYGNVSANDADARSENQINRNLSFKSTVFEIALGYEIDLFKYRINDMKYPITPYFFYQLAYTRINPTTEFNGNDVALQPLGTEGQGTVTNDKNPYSLNQIAVPLGIGLKFNLRKRVAVSMEYGIRKTFTDYLDDVSGNYGDADVLRGANGPLAAELANRSINETSALNRGNPGNKDWYVFYGVMLTFKPFEKSVCERMKGR